MKQQARERQAPNNLSENSEKQKLEQYFDIALESTLSKMRLTELAKKRWLADMKHHKNHFIDLAMKNPKPAVRLGVLMRDRTYLNKLNQAEQSGNVEKFKDNIISFSELQRAKKQKSTEVSPEEAVAMATQEAKARAEQSSGRTKLKATVEIQKISKELSVSSARLDTLQRRFSEISDQINFSWNDFVKASSVPTEPSGIFGRIKSWFKKPEATQMKMYNQMVKAYDRLVER
ncbi:MAG: hypothetical protein ABIH67_03900 [Candidatus Uhrbacteria bacterium]